MAATWTPWFEGKSNTGTPLVGGKLFTYAAGTSTPLATYTDQSGAVQNANPVLLDAAGRANVWLTPGALYKLVMQSSAGVIIRTQDNFAVADPLGLSTFIEVLAGPDGFSKIGGFASYDQLRAYAGSGSRVSVFGPVVTSGKPKINGVFRRVANALADNGGTIIVDNLGRSWIREYQGYIRPEWFDTTVGADISRSAIIAAAGAGPIVFSAGLNYLVDTDNIPVASGFRAKGEEGHTLTCSFTGKGFKTAVFKAADSASNIRINNIKVVNVPTLDQDYDRHLFQGRSVSDVRMDGNDCTNCAHGFVGTIVETYGGPDDPTAYSKVITDESNAGFNQSRDCIFTNFKVRGNQANRQLVGEANYFRYATRCSAVGGDVQDVYFANLAWGGNSGNSEGTAGNERKCSLIRVSQITARRLVAGPWGSMVDRITQSLCEGVDGTDVGIDFEGCTNFKADNCTMSGFANGNYATFFSNKLGVFTACTSVQAASNAPHVRINNSSLNGAVNRQIGFNGCTFETLGIIGIVDDAGGPASELKYIGCKFINTSMVLTAPNKENLKVIDNEFIFTIAAGGAFTALQVTGIAGMSSRIAGNTVYSTVAQPAGSIGIDVINTDGNSVPVFDVVDNTTQGFPIDIRFGCTSANAGLPGIFRVNRNMFGSNSIAYLNPSRVQFRAWEDNLRGDTSVIPLPTP